MGFGGDRMANLGSNLKPVEWKHTSLAAVQKNFYNEHPSVAARTREEVDRWLERANITRHGRDLPNPVTSFEDV